MVLPISVWQHTSFLYAKILSGNEIAHILGTKDFNVKLDP
jgi:hypothetical protein